MKLWSKLLIIRKTNEHWKHIMLHLELCLCTLFYNARDFSVKVVKTQLRSTLSAESLHSMRITIKGLSLEEFNQDYASKCTNVWYNSKARRLNQRKQKEHTEQKSNKRKREKFEVNEFTSETSSCSSEEEC